MERRRKSAPDAARFRAVVVHDLAQARAAAIAAAALQKPFGLVQIREVMGGPKAG